ncbi:hypothetical protein [Streptomyces sp. NPDC086147]|uniref:hypothetical protein n=1 Tax=Streptomyces sp. NPDC086147 TaxID=3155295 RepID=UPI00344B478D
MDAAATIAHLTGILDAHYGGWSSDDIALLALHVIPLALPRPRLAAPSVMLER